MARGLVRASLPLPSSKRTRSEGAERQQPKQAKTLAEAAGHKRELRGNEARNRACSV